MNIEDELRLSYYQPVADINASHGVTLVKHAENGRFFVRKSIRSGDKTIYEALKENSYAGIPRIYECVEDGSDLVIIEEYISGKTLAYTLEENGNFNEKSAIFLLIRLCDILTPLHDNHPPIIHRDIKPSNIMQTEDGSVYLLDFDAGKLYEEGKARDTVLMGTAGYAAPEQYGFAQSDQRTDIYSLGVLLEELIGKENTAAANCRHVIEKCMSIDPAGRYRTVGKLKNALTKLAHQDPEKTSKNAYEKSFLPPGFRTKKPITAICALLWYAFIVYLAISPLDDSGGFRRHDYLLMASALLVTTFVAGNYRGAAKWIPLLRSDNLAFRILGAAVTLSVTFSIAIIIAMAIDILIF